MNGCSIKRQGTTRHSLDAGRVVLFFSSAAALLGNSGDIFHNSRIFEQNLTAKKALKMVSSCEMGRWKEFLQFMTCKKYFPQAIYYELYPSDLLNDL